VQHKLSEEKTAVGVSCLNAKQANGARVSVRSFTELGVRFLFAGVVEVGSARVGGVGVCK